MFFCSCYNICVLGHSGVGRTSFVARTIAGNYVDNYDPTIEGSYRRQIAVDDETCALELLEENEEYNMQRMDQWIRGCDGFVVMYSICSQASFCQVTNVIARVMSVRGEEVENIPIVVMGNKCDMEDTREVSTQEGLDLGKKYGVAFREGSVKVGVNADEVICDLVRKIREIRARNTRNRGGGCVMM